MRGRGNAPATIQRNLASLRWYVRGVTPLPLSPEPAYEVMIIRKGNKQTNVIVRNQSKIAIAFSNKAAPRFLEIRGR